MKNIYLILFLALCTTDTFAQIQAKVSLGNLEILPSFKSKYVTDRKIEVWLPENYTTTKKYNVLYMHDGQMLFDAETTWNKQAWEVDETIGNLLKENKIKDLIVVGIWNGEATRHMDYFPQKPFESLSKSQQDSIFEANRNNGQKVFTTHKLNSDNYLKFLVTEVKPLVDKKYSVYTDAQHTFVAGSSMGGLISMYALCEYPKVFGGAICMSTHWPGIFKVDGNPIPKAFFDYMSKKLPDPKNHKIYFDYGTETLDALYQTLQPKADIILKQKGYNAKNWLTKKFIGDDHSEKSWGNRFAIPIEFMLGNKTI